LSILAWWREILIGILVLAIGVQSYRLQGAKAERDILALEKTERLRRDAMREATNLRNRERTDEEYAAARRRAGAVVVRVNGPGIRAPQIPAGSSDEGSICLDGRSLAEELSGWVQRDGERLGKLLERIRQRSTGNAQAGEEVSAAYRACRAFTLSLE
jgi:hypothetical protein